MEGIVITPSLPDEGMNEQILRSRSRAASRAYLQKVNSIKGARSVIHSGATSPVVMDDLGTSLLSDQDKPIAEGDGKPIQDGPILSTWKRIAYGAGDSANSISAAILGFFLLSFLLEVAGLNPVLASLVLLISKIFDAISDPIVGRLSDMTKTRWGRRRPWLVIFAIPFAVVFILMFQVPFPKTDQMGLFFYYLIVLILLNTFYTTIAVPHVALTPEITLDYQERNELTAYKLITTVISSLVGSIGHSLILAAYPGDPKQGYVVSALVFGTWMMLPPWMTAISVKELYAVPPDMTPFLDQVKQAGKNKEFRELCFLYLFSWLAVQFVQSNIVLYLKYALKLHSASGVVVIIAVVQITTAIGIGGAGALIPKYGKKKIFYAGSLWLMPFMAVLGILPEGTPLFWIAFLSFFAGIGIAALFIIPFAMVPDVIDLDELNNGSRREGIFYGLFIFLQKLGISVGLAIASLILGGAGYDVNLAEQPESVGTALRIMLGLFPPVLLGIALLFAKRYSITKEVHADIMSRLVAKEEIMGSEDGINNEDL